jgi:hypothetical protein
VSDLEMVVLSGCLLVGVAGKLWLFWVAFQKSLTWGLGCMLVPFVSLLFLLQHSDKAWKPFLMYFGGIGSVVVWAALTAPPLDPPPASFPGRPAPTAVAPREEPAAPSRKAPAKKTRRVRTWQQVPTE